MNQAAGGAGLSGEELDFEDEGGVFGDGADLDLAVTEGGWNEDDGATAAAHMLQAGRHARHEPADATFEWFFRALKLRTVLQAANVVKSHRRARNGHGAVAFLHREHTESGGAPLDRGITRLLAEAFHTLLDHCLFGGGLGGRGGPSLPVLQIIRARAEGDEQEHGHDDAFHANHPGRGRAGGRFDSPAGGRGLVLVAMIQPAFMPRPRNLSSTDQRVPFPSLIGVTGLDPSAPADQRTRETLENIVAGLPGVELRFDAEAEYGIRFVAETAMTEAEGYRLVSDASGLTVMARTAAGRFYAAQTIYQLLAHAYHGDSFRRFEHAVSPAAVAAARSVPGLTIEDAPRYAVRGFMADLGRSTWSMPLLRRLVRIMAHLKMNLLHLHLMDDELCGFRCAQLPLGRENPGALDAAALRELIAYARSYHIAVMPEIESWGHVNSVTYHYPELRGAAGQFGGSSFAIGEPTYALLEKIYDEIVPCLEDEASVHLGLDEALWAVLPGEEDRGHTPESHVARLFDILQRVGARHGKKLTMHVWADHGGRPIPAELREKIVVQPWAYRPSDGPQIDEAMSRYAGEGCPPIMLGGGASWVKVHGDCEASRLWALAADPHANILGLTACFWGLNDLAGRLITLYGGAGFAWNPHDPAPTAESGPDYWLRCEIDQQMRMWQVLFPDADPDAINADRGPEEELGRYVWPPRAREAVAPTADFFPGEKPPAA